MAKIKAVIFDLDGTLYLGDDITEGSLETIEKLHNMGIKTFYLTNNSSKSRKQILKKLNNIGIPSELNEIYSSAYIGARLIQKMKMDKPYVFGSCGLKNEFADQGIDICEDEDCSKNLIIGYDPDCTYEKITLALRAALHADMIIACNKERIYPGNDGKMMPGCGAMAASIEWCANRNVDCIIGKPETTMLEILCEENSLKNDEILIVGDTYESDIAMAEKYHAKSILIGHNDNAEQPQIESMTEFLTIFTVLNNNSG